MKTAFAADRVWNKESILEALATSDKAVAECLQALYQRQTASEQSAMSTHVANGRGFNSRDARFLSDVASRMPRYGNTLTHRQTAAVRKALYKYHRQILEIIAERGGQVEQGLPADNRQAVMPVDVAEQGRVAVSGWGIF